MPLRIPPPNHADRDCHEDHVPEKVQSVRHEQIAEYRPGCFRTEAGYLFRRPMMHGNQRAMIANQVQELQKLVAQFETVRNQLTEVTDSVQGRVGSITEPMAELVATPTDLLNTTRAWHSDFTGQAGSMVDSLRGLAANGESFSRSWRDVLQAVDTVTEADIRDIYQDGADAAVATFERQRAEGDRRLEYAGARADVGADLMQIHAATTGAIGRIGERVDADPGSGAPNRSAAALTEGDVLGSLAQIRTLIGIGRSRALVATEDAAARFRQEELGVEEQWNENAR